MPKLELSLGDLSLSIEQEQEISPEYVKSIIDLVTLIPTPKQTASTAGSSNSVDSELTMNTVVTKLNAKSLKELLEAGAFFSHLQSNDGIFSRSSWEDNTSSALRWDKSMVKNRSTYIKRAIDAGIVIEKAGDRFALSPEFEQQTRSALG